MICQGYPASVYSVDEVTEVSTHVSMVFFFYFVVAGGLNYDIGGGGINGEEAVPLPVLDSIDA